MRISTSIVSLLVAASAAFSLPASASGIHGCVSPCDPNPYGAKRLSVVPPKAGQKALGGETLTGEFAGDWDVVTANVTFPYDEISELDLLFVALSLPATAQGDNQYAAPGWNRELFFLDIGDGVPRLLSAALLDVNHSPDPDDAVTESGQLWLVQFVLYREIDELNRNANFYDSYPDEASNADLRFVTDDDGEVLQVVVDIYDEFDDYMYSVEPLDGDSFNPGILGYDLADPDSVYIMYYFDELIALSDDMSLERRYYVPSGAGDTALPEDFDSADTPLTVVFEGQAGEGETLEFGYSPARSLGYTWGKAQQIAEPTAQASSSGAISPLISLLFMLMAGLRARSRWSAATQ